MPFWRLLVLVNLAAAFYDVGTIVLAQVDWQLWRYVGRDRFPQYHLGWWHSVWWSVFPVLGLSTLGIIAQLFWGPPVPAWMPWASFLLLALSYLGTVLWWGAGQARLEQAVTPDGSLNPAYVRLVNTHWIRVILIAAVGLLQLWIAIVSLT
jgi:hypothetical protein